MKKIYFLLAFFAFNTAIYAQKDTLKASNTPIFSIKVAPLSFKPNQIVKITIDTLLLVDEKDNTSKKSTLNAVTTGSNYYVPPSPIDAGRTAGVIDVSPSGAAIYNIPIAIPPGVNGVTPHIALNYNSQTGNGLAGYGWNVSGLSSISRIPATFFHDGFVGGVNFDLNDRFALDGQRLILKSGIYGADGAEYQTENFSNIKIISRGVANFAPNNVLGPAYFEVFYPDGSKAFFGLSYNSKSPNNYAISYTQNPLGIKIFYDYLFQNNSLYISTIKYGGLTEASSLNTINFLYKNRTRTEQNFIGDINLFNNKLLYEIKVLGAGNTGYRNYVLTHNTVISLGYERVTSVQEFNGDKTKNFEPIVFNYETTPNNIIHTNASNLDYTGYNATTTQVLTCDFTGDGKMDFVTYPNSKSSIRLYSGDEISQNNYGPQFSTELNTGSFEEIFPITWLTHNNKIIPGQGIGLVKSVNASTVKFEILSPSIAGTGISQQYNKVWQNIPVTPFYSSWCYGNNNLTVGGHEIRKKYITGDFNGDGLTDIIAVTKSYYAGVREYSLPCTTGSTTMCCNRVGSTVNVSKTYFINLDRRITTNFVNEAGNLQVYYQDGDKLTTGDFNGDGKTDIYHFKNGVVYIYTLDNQNNLKFLWSQTDSRINLTYNALFGDYNGDGKTDFMFPTNTDTNIFATFISTGKNFKKTESGMAFVNSKFNWNGQTATMTASNLIANDIDGDGKTDMVKYTATTKNDQTTGSLNVFVYHNYGSATFNDPPAFSHGATTFKTINLVHYPIPLFLTSDKPNLSLEFGILSDNSINLFRFTKDIKKETQLSSVVQDGVTFSVDYKSLVTQSSGNTGINLYESRQDQIYPYIAIASAPGLNVVSKLKRTYFYSQVQQVFGYRYAVSNLEGLGFMGFGQTIKSNWHIDGIYNNRLFSISVSNPQNRGAATKSFSSKNTYISDAIMADPNAGTLNDYINRTDYTYTTELLTSKVYKNNVTAVSSKDLLNATNTTVGYIYDAYNNVTKETSNFSGQGTKTVDVLYNNYLGATHYIGQPYNKKTTLTNATDVYTTEEQISYTGFLPTTIKNKGHNTGFMTDVVVYDAFGNITQKTTTAPSGAQRSIKMEYDPSGRFRVKNTDVENLSTTYQYNLVNGNVLEQTNPYGQVSNSDYDSWGRLTSSTDYLGVSTFREYIKSDSNLEKHEYDDTGLEKRTIINALGLTILQETKNVKNQWVESLFLYDQLDKLYKQSEPAFYSDDTKWNETFIDEYGRVKQVKAYTGKTTNITYSGLTTTINDGTKTTSTTKNALGQVTETTDPGGTIKNTYYANGNLKTADYAGSLQSIEYDGWGRKTKLTDPSAGVYTYAYNDFGETTRESTPKGTTNYTYDATGKLTGKTITGSGTSMNYVYTYNPTTKLLTALNLTTNDNNNTQYTYTYDAKFRPLSTVETNPYAIFTKAFDYDMYGRLNTEQSTALNKANNKTATKTVKNNYQNGQLLNITDNGTGIKIWEVTAVNARGQVTAANLGTAITQTNLYDQYGLPQEIKTNRIGASPAQLLKLNYGFDVIRGNLEYRRNSAFSRDEKFTYDNLDRLTKTELLVNGFVNSSQSQTYDLQGRTTSHSDLGTFTYNGYQQTGLKDLKPTAATYYQGRPTQQISYNAFKSPVQIYEAGKDRISFLYNAAQDRSTMFYGGEQTDQLQRRYRRHYSEDGSMEITNDAQINTTSFVFYLGGDAYTAPAIWKEEFHIPSGQYRRNLYYLHRDYQGTILQITNATGQIQENRLFDAWGNVLKITDAANNIVANFIITDRGYTGHEHLVSVGLINMNARLYDPKLHRFLSPDNYVQDPSNTQNFNRYGYVMNNPLTRIDPSGEFIHLIIGAIIGGVVNWVANGAEFSWKGLAHFGVGAAAGALSAGIGAGVNVAMAGGSFGAGFMGTAVGVSSTGFLAGAATGAAVGFTNGFITGAGNKALNGGSFGESLGAGLGSGFKQGITGGIAGGIFGGIDALTKKVDFFTGKTNLDLSKGVGAHGITNTNQTVSGKYVGKYEGTNVYESTQLGSGRTSGGITLPGRGIIVGKGAFTNSMNPYTELMQHEFGHILQSREVGLINFYRVIGRESLMSASLDRIGNYSHSTFWTETWANFLSSKYFGSRYINSSDFPIRDIDFSNFLKFSLW